MDLFVMENELFGSNFSKVVPSMLYKKSSLSIISSSFLYCSH